jgi:MFS transporter, DHA3 family, macrolide efflux protein
MGREMERKYQTGLNAFRILWAGQSLSLLGSGMTRFAVMIWAFQVQGTATALALLGFFNCLTYVIASPMAGVLVDRWNRRTVMVFADLGAGLATAFLLVMFTLGRLELWHLYLAVGMVGVFEAFQEPAFSASVSLLVPRQEYTRSNALLGLGKSAARMLSPAIAGILLPVAGLGVIMLVDLATMSLAMLGLAFVRIPRPTASLEGRRAEGSFWRQVRFGGAYILRRPGLRGLLFSFFLINLFGTLTYFAVLSPMVLARTGGNETILGWVRTAMGMGGIAGGLVVSARGFSKNKARVYLLSVTLSFLVCDAMMATSTSAAGWIAAGLLAEFSIAFIVSPYFAIWQEVVPTDIQGRVFAMREMVQVASQPVGYLAGGLLADYLFEPFMLGGSGLAAALSGLVGFGPGSGMAVMFLFTSLFGGLTGLLGLLSPSIRRLDEGEASMDVDRLAANSPGLDIL